MDTPTSDPTPTFWHGSIQARLTIKPPHDGRCAIVIRADIRHDGRGQMSPAFIGRNSDDATASTSPGAPRPVQRTRVAAIRATGGSLRLASSRSRSATCRASPRTSPRFVTSSLPAGRTTPGPAVPSVPGHASAARGLFSRRRLGHRRCGDRRQAVPRARQCIAMRRGVGELSTEPGDQVSRAGRGLLLGHALAGRVSPRARGRPEAVGGRR
jgi:hypothetical protein